MDIDGGCGKVTGDVNKAFVVIVVVVSESTCGNGVLLVIRGTFIINWGLGLKEVKVFMVKRQC